MIRERKRVKKKERGRDLGGNQKSLGYDKLPPTDNLRSTGFLVNWVS